MTEKIIEQQSCASHEYENGLAQASFLSPEQYRHLQHVEGGFGNELKDDGEPVWYSFAEYGYRDEAGNILALYNDFHRQSEKEGWQLWVCPPEEVEFQKIALNSCRRTDFTQFDHEADSKKIKVSFQLGIEPGQVYGDGFNDILNIVCYDQWPASVRFWSHSTEADQLRGVRGLPLGGQAIKQCLPAA